MANLFPSIQPFNSGHLSVSDLHTIYYEECGNPNGKPVVFLHGGPGGGLDDAYRRFFDPEFYRIILFDQRGCGKSTPFAELKENTTWDIVADIEKIREHLGIESWLVFGGSWGSTLALSYSITHPDKVVGLILRGIFLCRSFEIQWFYQEGASFLFPDAWEKYTAVIPEEEQHDFVSAYYKRLTSDDKNVQLEAARAWSIWEASTSKLLFDADAVEKFNEPELALPFARIECHYFINKVFVESDTYLLEQIAQKLTHLPCRIVQGRYDVVCPVRSAWDLKKVWHSADLRIVPDAGHSALETKIASELVQATEDFKTIYS